MEAQDVAEEERGEEVEVAEEVVAVHPWASSFLRHQVIAPLVEDRALGDQLALFRAAGRRAGGVAGRGGAPRAPARREEVAVPEDHCTTLAVQFSMFSGQSCLAPSYCVLPWVLHMRLYGHLDIALGDFLDTLCFAPDYVCPNKGCGTPPLLHTRRFCHAGGAVTLHMQRLEAPIVGEGSDKLVMWKYCTSCELITNIVPVTDATWSLSFAQFLHLLLHERRLVRRGAGRPDAMCRHSLHQQHLTCFGKGDLVATFKYSRLQVWRLSCPPPRLSLPSPSPSPAAVLAALAGVKDTANTLHSAVLERLLALRAEGGAAVEVLCGEEEGERAEHRAALLELEEGLGAGEGQAATMARLRRLQRDLAVYRLAWARRLAGADVRGKARPPAAASDPADTDHKEETTGTVKKLISTILPHSEDALELPPALPADLHLITATEPPSFVSELRPSSLIAHLLASPQHSAFLAAAGPADPHLVLEFASAAAKFYCCSYFSAEFHRLRELIFPGGGANFVASLGDCRRWEAMGGKSGLLFYKTTDDRFVLKQMSRFEFQSFLEFAPHYFHYLEKSVARGEQTLLAKIVGVYKVGLKNSATGQGMNMEFLVMENLFHGKEVSKSYDLKGSERNRLMAEEGGAADGQVLLDENLIRVSCESPLYLGAADKEALNEALQRDTAFLASHEMMDYSLLAGICPQGDQLVVGIIDYIRTFTWDKKLETLVKSVKSSGVFGGPAKTPTVIKPDIYKVRFTEAMNRYFSSVPD